MGFLAHQPTRDQLPSSRCSGRSRKRRLADHHFEGSLPVEQLTVERVQEPKAQAAVVELELEPEVGAELEPEVGTDRKAAAGELAGSYMANSEVHSIRSAKQTIRN